MSYEVTDAGPGEACWACGSGTRVIVTVVRYRERDVKAKVCADAKKCKERFTHGLTWRGHLAALKRG